MQKLVNSEYWFFEENVGLHVYIYYDSMSFQINEPHQEGVFYGDLINLDVCKIKARLI